MEFILEFLFSLFFEFALEFFGQLLIEFGLRSLGEPFVERERRNPIFAAVGYFLLGLILGGLSLLIFPQSFVRSQRLHGISLLITPVLAGLGMAAVGRLRVKRGQTLLRLDSFVYGFIFAFAMALVRFNYTT